MGELSIKIKIANRVYPLTVDSSEEEGIRNAAEKINQSIDDFERLYAVKDKQIIDSFELNNLYSTYKIVADETEADRNKTSTLNAHL